MSFVADPNSGLLEANAERDMRLKVPKIDGRSRRALHDHDVVDLDTGASVGTLESRLGETWLDTKDPARTRIPSRTIALFNGKYKGRFKTHDECVAFAAGVEAVLNHITSAGRNELPAREPHREAPKRLSMNLRPSQ